jgi:hypothetical protein
MTSRADIIKAQEVKKNKLDIKVTKSDGQFGEGFTIWVNGRWILDASCFSQDFTFSIDNFRCKRIGHTDGHHGKDTYKFDKRKTK